MEGNAKLTDLLQQALNLINND